MVAELSGVEHIYWLTDARGKTFNALNGRITVLDAQDYYLPDPTVDGLVDDYHPLFTDEILDCYHRLLPVHLMMQDRVELHGPPVSYQARKKSFHRQFTFWLQFLRQRNIDFFLTGNIPHEMTDFVIGELCRVLGIRSLSFMQLGVDGVVAVSHYTELGADAMRREAPLQQGAERQIEEEFRKRAKRAVAIEQQRAASYIYMNKSFWKRVKLDAWKRTGRRLKGKFEAGNLRLNRQSLRYAAYLAYDKPVRLRLRDKHSRNEYRDISESNPDLNLPFVYFALHFQPELTTVPMGGKMADQYLVAELLLAAFSPEVKIYIKEHPNQNSLGRGPGYYDQFPSSDRLVFISQEVSTFSLQHGCLAVATLTGTVGFEALWFSKPVLMFGYGYYRDAPGVYFIDSVTSAQTAANELMSGNQGPGTKEMEDYMSALAKRVIPANVSQYRHVVSGMKLSSSENSNRLLAEIVVRFGGLQKTNQ